MRKERLNNGNVPIEQTPPAVAELGRLVLGRRSIRRYAPGPIERSVLEDLLTFATWAPSAHNRQPWRFCVVTQGEVKERLSRRMGEFWRAELAADGVDAATIAARVATSHVRMTGAAALVAACVTLEAMDVYPDARRNQAEWTMAVQSAALACQNLLLAAHAYGLGACWMCAPLFAPEIVVAELELPESWQPQALITLGYPAEEKRKERESLESRVLWR